MTVKCEYKEQRDQKNHRISYFFLFYLDFLKNRFVYNLISKVKIPGVPTNFGQLFRDLFREFGDKNRESSFLKI